MEKDQETPCQNRPFKNKTLEIGDVVVVRKIVDKGDGDQKTVIVGSGTVEELGPGVWIWGLREKYGLEAIMRGESGNLRFQAFYPDD